jgi:hypothetical protein
VDLPAHLFTSARACRDGPLLFKFSKVACKASGYLCFTCAPSPLLLVSDSYNDAVHLVDVHHETLVGYLFPPGTLVRPRGVAASPAMIGISSWEDGSSAHEIHLFDAGTHAHIRAIGGRHGSLDGQLFKPFGLRFSRDGLHVVVADHANNRVSMFRVADGAFVRHVTAKAEEVRDVEECSGGWLAACQGSRSVRGSGPQQYGGWVVVSSRPRVAVSPVLRLPLPAP